MQDEYHVKARARTKAAREANPQASRDRKKSFYHTNAAYRESVKRRIREKRANDPQWYLWDKAKRRALKQGVPFDIEPSDIVIPTRCPALGIPISVLSKERVGSATVDRCVPNLGYVPGNIAVISHRANSIKRDATLDELRSIVRWMERQKGRKR